MVTIQARQLLGNDSDAEGDALRITAHRDAINGLVTLDGNTIVYVHDGSETTLGGFTYTVTDGADTATVRGDHHCQPGQRPTGRRRGRH